MPRINLLPVKAARLRDTAKNELYAVIGLIFMTLFGLYLWHSNVESEITEFRTQMADIDRDIERLLQDVGKVRGFQEKQKAVEQKLMVIKQLMAKKVGPARMLDELAMILTNESKRVWLKSLGEVGGVMTLQGMAVEHEDVSEFQIALARAEFFRGVKLEYVTSKPFEGRTLVSWKITCRIHYKVSG